MENVSGPADGPCRLLHVFSTFSVGGPQIRFVQIVKGLGAEFEHCVIAMDGRYDCYSSLSDTSNVYIKRLSDDQAGFWGRLAHYRQFIREQGPDRLITYNWGAIEWAAANVFPICPHIHIEDGFGPEEADRQLLRRSLFRRLVLSRQSQVVLPSQTLVEIAKGPWRLPEKQVHYIPNGVDLSTCGSVTQEEARAAFNLPKGQFVIGTLATLRPEKNLMRLIDAFCALPERSQCHLVIAGAGRELGALQAHVAKRDLERDVSFPGFVKDPFSLLPAFDLFALSSDTEQMPLSILEAMAAGLAVASTDVGDVGRMVAPEGREFVCGKSRLALEKSLSALIANTDHRSQIGKANQSLARDKFDLKKMLASYRKLFIYG
jgi:glycosyltransferase involved in cell wall biosynthesis